MSWGSDRGVWEVTVVARRSEARKEEEELPAGLSRDRQGLFCETPRPPGEAARNPLGSSREELVE